MPEERCPQCGAAVRPQAPWCTQCFAPTGATREDRLGREVHRQPVPASIDPTLPAPRRPVDEAPVEQPPVQRSPVREAHVPAPPLPVAGPPAASDDASWPCGACGARTPLAETVCGACGSAFLAGARGAPPTLVLPLVGDVAALSPVHLVALAMTLLSALLLAGLVGGALLG